MKKRQNLNLNHNQSFKGFLEVEPRTVDPAVEKLLLDQIHLKLNPPLSRVFMKILMIQGITGASTLLFCPQFGTSWGGGMGLMVHFSRLGPVGCLSACGAVFTGVSWIVISSILNPEEVLVLQKYKWFQLSAILMISLGILTYLGTATSLSATVSWLAGAFSAAWLGLELGWRLRHSFIQRNLWEPPL